MVVTVVGKRVVRKKIDGKNKWRYGTVVHSVYHDDSVEGVAVKSFWLNGVQFPVEYVEVGKNYQISERNQYITSFVKEQENDD